MGGGLLARSLDDRPPLAVRARFHLLSWRVPSDSQGWVEDRIRSPYWPAWEALRRGALISTIVVWPSYVIRGMTFTELLTGALTAVLCGFVYLAQIAKDVDTARQGELAYQRGDGLHWMRRDKPESLPWRSVAAWGGSGLMLAVGITLVFVALR